MTVRLSSGGITKTFPLHRLIAELFVSNPGQLPIVNHINDDRLDNRLENLEWVTHAQNVQHAYDCGLINQKSKCRQVIDICTGRKFNSIREAAEDLNIPYSTCRNYLSGKNISNTSCLRYIHDVAA